RFGLWRRLAKKSKATQQTENRDWADGFGEMLRLHTIVVAIAITCSRKRSCLVSSFSQNGLLNFGWNGQKYKAAGRKKVVFATLIDDAHVIVALGIRVRQDRINLAPLERHLIVGVINTNCYTMTQIAFCHN